MNKTKIDWADYTWNPVTGCYHGCKYCYARRIVRRFGRKNYELSIDKKNRILTSPKNIIGGYKGPYPWGFNSTLHKYRLDEPQKLKKPSNIFVSSMGDLFGEWVPDYWIQKVFEACQKAPWHRYMFLTKNPGRYVELAKKGLLVNETNYWYGSTATNSKMSRFIKPKGDATKYNTFISIEPILQPWDIDPYEEFESTQWVIIGAETGNRKGKAIPEKEWIMAIKKACERAGTPLFMKESLKEIMGQDFIQEFPW